MMISIINHLRQYLTVGSKVDPKMCCFMQLQTEDTLMPRDMIENEKSSSINPSEAVEEKVSLSDRFGLWLGFHPCTQDEYLEMIFVIVTNMVCQYGFEFHKGASY